MGGEIFCVEKKEDVEGEFERGGGLGLSKQKLKKRTIENRNGNRIGISISCSYFT